MAAFTTLVWLQRLRPEQRLRLGLPPDTPDPKSGSGAKLRITPAVMAALDAGVERRKRDIDNRVVSCEFYKEYGDRCTDARAIASIAAEQLRERRIEREGWNPVTADEHVNGYVRTPAFAGRLKRLKERLSRYRRSAGR